MNQLATAIQSLGLTGTATEVRVALDTNGDPIIDSTSYSLSGLAGRLAILGVAVEHLIGLRGHIRDLPIGGDTLEGFLIAGGGQSGGVDCSRADLRYQFEVNQGHPSTTEAQQAILAGMLLVGSRPRKKYQQAGLGSLPSEADITTALAQSSFATWAENAIQTLQAAINGEQTNIAEYKQIISEL